MAETADTIITSKTDQNQPRTCSGFLSKAIVASVFIALLPLFPSQAPEFISPPFFTRSWELLHLLVVGIAISYGLFSRRNSDPELEKDPSWKSDTPQSYVSQIFHVSSVFDEDEAETETPPSRSPDESKIQTWSSQYQRRDPVVVLAEKNNDGGKGGGSKPPLFLPVRSLRTSSPDGMDEMGNGIEDSRNERKDCVVLPSPIPWKSRSGRMEFTKDETMVSPPNSAIDAGLGTFKTPSFRSSIPSSPSINSSSIPPPPPLSPELRGKTSEDLGKKKKSFSMVSPPPVPPPPPPPLPLNHPSHSISTKNDTRRSFKEELEDLSARERGRPKQPEIIKPSPGRSVRTVRFAPEKRGKATSGEDEKMVSEIRHPSPLPTYQTEKRDGSIVEKKKVAMFSPEESEGDDESCSSVASSEGEEEEEEESHGGSGGRGVDDEENEVDKKADEFIAKFREQIRLQRIESIKKSTGQRRISTTTSRSSSK